MAHASLLLAHKIAWGVWIRWNGLYGMERWNGIVDWNTGMPRPLSLSQCRAYPPAWPKVLAELTRYTGHFGHLIQHSALFWSGEPHSLLTSLTTLHSTVYHIAGNLREKKRSQKFSSRTSRARNQYLQYLVCRL